MINSELKPCPFCGGRAYLISREKFKKKGKYIYCKNCRASSNDEYTTNENAIAAWNERHISWGLLMDILDNYYPADIFSDLKSQLSKDIGSQIARKIREINELRKP
jgi:Lar family restriction alleviation protein